MGRINYQITRLLDCKQQYEWGDGNKTNIL